METVGTVSRFPPRAAKDQKYIKPHGTAVASGRGPQCSGPRGSERQAAGSTARCLWLVVAELKMVGWSAKGVAHLGFDRGSPDSAKPWSCSVIGRCPVPCM